MRLFLLAQLIFLSITHGLAQPEHSVARKWNEVLLDAVRNDLARPTIHARNLFHVSAAMYDAWVAFEPNASTFFLGRDVGEFPIVFEEFPEFNTSDKQSLQREAISYACYRLIQHRFRNAPGFSTIEQEINQLMDDLGYDRNYFETDYTGGSAAALGNYIADRIKAFGLQDGANELGSYGNNYYEPINEPLKLVSGGENMLTNPNRWQPLEFDEAFIDQSGNLIEAGKIPFLSPEWGDCIPFAFTEGDASRYIRDGMEYTVYQDPGHPAFIDTLSGVSISDPYKWGFSLVAIWSSHLDATDGEMIEVSPNSIGNINPEDIPDDFADYPEFYDLLNGGDISKGYDINPKTGMPYEEQWVPRGDYSRVLAEFWADGPDSETPPGHWFTILNYVNDQPELEKRFKGEGAVLDDLEWDVKAYFILGGTMHDAAMAAWSVKGYYDYIRPISAIRYMATRGQSSDPEMPNYSKAGIPLVPGKIELIGEGDELAGENGENINEIKLFAWKGHDYIDDAETDTAGVGWILAHDWWPYQRPSFVTPPFAGYVSGHSTFSRSAAEVLTMLTGDEYFPGGLGEFHAGQNDFLVFEQGPSVDVVLQWAKYVDASDQCSLSRIWGGIHPPVDDLPGRKMGMAIAQRSFSFAEDVFNRRVLAIESDTQNQFQVFPNPASDLLRIKGARKGELVLFRDTGGKIIYSQNYNGDGIPLSTFEKGLYLVTVNEETQKLLIE